MNAQNSVQTPCPYCDRLFKARGIKRHITSAHPEAHRQGILNDLTPTLLNVTDSECDAEVLTLNAEFDSLLIKFDELLSRNEAKHCAFDLMCDTFKQILRKCEIELPGPKNPAKKYYELRKSDSGFKNIDSGYSTSSNPQRASNRKRKARKNAHEENLIQYLFYNQRKKAVRIIMNSNDQKCVIPLDVLEKDFSNRWSTPNNQIGPCYSRTSEQSQNEIDSNYCPTISPEEVKLQIKRMNVDTSPGPDGILPRWVKATLKKSKIVIANIITYMLTHNYVPDFLREAKTVLIFKSGDPNSTKNWRPITVSSVIRRIIEKVLDRNLRTYIDINNNQRGFTNAAGTLINTTLINECLKKAKRDKSDCTVIFGDITQAFDNVGHEHMFAQIHSKPAPTLLKLLTCNMAAGNYTRINTMQGKTGIIKFKRGVMQGGPMSPFLFNVTIDTMIQELSEKEITEAFGFSLHPFHDKVTNAEFADDTGIVGNSRHSAIELFQQSTEALSQMGLQMNPPKSVAISIVKGELCEEPLRISGNTCIRCIGAEETIKYLGVTFNDCIVFDEGKCAHQFNNKIEKLVATPMLRPDQKLKILKDYLWPTLIYPFQHAPLSKLSTKFLDSIDKIIRSSAKEILTLPIATPTSMLYSSSKVKGLGLIRAKWEAGIQNFNSLETLLLSDHPLLHEIKDLQGEQEESLDFLNIPTEIRSKLPEIQKTKTKKSKIIREHLRRLEYDNWCKLPQKGQGVIQFQECPSANKWIHSKNGLSTSEWVTSIKMTSYVLPVKAIPRPDLGSDLYCRFGCKETETLGHVLGKCHRGELLRNNRHHAIRRLIAEAMGKLGWKVLQEVECSATEVSKDGKNTSEDVEYQNGSVRGTASRRIDIIAYDLQTKQGLILDPTIRMEQDANQAESVHQEKKAIYDPCIQYFKEKLGLVDIQVIGLYIGARGTITKFFLDFMKDHHLPATLIEDVVTTVLKKSVQICVHHLYSTVPDT